MKGQPVAQRWPERTVEERFMEKIVIDAATGCWVWQAALSRHGYSWFSIKGSPKHGHTVAYELFAGPVPSGLTLDHTCHNADESCSGGPTCLHRRCVNPAHLELVTLAENKARGRSPAAINARKDRCFRGHLFDDKNTHYPPSGGRSCRACNRLEKQELAAAKRAARPDRICEAAGCSNIIAGATRPDKVTCSPTCRTKRYRALLGERQLCVC